MPRFPGFVLASALFLTASGSGTFAQGTSGQFTGCLTKGGTIAKLVAGGSPIRPCGRGQTQITLQGAAQSGGVEIVPFNVALDGDGAEKTIATNGPLEIFARCNLDVPDPFDPRPPSDIISIIATSTEDGWVASPSVGVRSAGEEVTIFVGREPAGTEFYGGSSAANSHGSAFAHDGSYIGVAADTTGLGANIFGHDCIAVGTAVLIKGNL